MAAVILSGTIQLTSHSLVFGQQSAPQQRNACFIRLQALRTIPGLAVALPGGEALNSASTSGISPAGALQAYDRALAGAIGGMGSSPEIAMRLLDAESLVDRISECGSQQGTNAALASSALDRAFQRNAPHYSLQSPSLVDDAARKRLQERMLASRRLAGALERVGRSEERANVMAQETQLVARARAEAEARWEAGRPQREAEERARWAQANAAERRQLTAEAIPDRALVTRAIMSEFREVGQTMTSLTFARAISELTTRPGDRAGYNEYWNLESGQATLSFGTGEYAMTQWYRFSIGNVVCRKVAGQRPSFSCDLDVQTFTEVNLAGSKILDIRSPEARLSTPIEWNGTRWSAPRVRAAMAAGVQNSAVAPSRRTVGNPNDSLCKSLYAGVVGAGGNSTSTALNPQTWGC